jgi:hypothetical protein
LGTLITAARPKGRQIEARWFFRRIELPAKKSKAGVFITDLFG